MADQSLDPDAEGLRGTLRPAQRWVALSFSLRRRVDHPIIVRKVMPYNGRYYHVANLRTPEDFDDALADWVIESYMDCE